jgi:hypothetical protein
MTGRACEYRNGAEGPARGGLSSADLTSSGRALALLQCLRSGRSRVGASLRERGRGRWPCVETGRGLGKIAHRVLEIGIRSNASLGARCVERSVACTRRVGTARPSTGRALAGPGRRAVRIDRARRCRLRNAAEDLGGTTIAATIGSAGERHQQPGRKDRRHQPRARNRCPRGIRGNRGRRCSARVRAGIAEAPPAPAGESRPAVLGGHARHLPLRSTPTRARRTAIRRRHAAIDRDVAPHRRRTVRVARARKPHTFARPAVGVGVAVEPGLRTIRRHGAGPCVRRSRREGRQQERDAPEHDRHRRATMRDNCLRVVHEVGLTVPLS